jgi:hypothetical protein
MDKLMLYTYIDALIITFLCCHISPWCHQADRNQTIQEENITGQTSQLVWGRADPVRFIIERSLKPS